MSLKGWLLRAGLTPTQRMHRSQLEELPAREGDVVFLGDSLAGGGNWNEWFPGQATRTLGIPGYTVGAVRGMIGLIEAPAAVVVLAGNSDLLGLGATSSPSSVAGKIADLVVALRGQIGRAPIVVVGVPPRGRIADASRALNQALSAALEGTTARFVSPPEGGDDDGFVLGVASWPGAVYREIAGAIGTHTGFEVAS